MSIEKVYKVTLPNGEVVSVKALYGPSRFERALADTDSEFVEYTADETPANNWCDFRNNIGGETFYGLRVRALEAQLKKERVNPKFQDAVQELCIIDHCAFDPADAMTTLKALIGWNVQIALDPSVSEPVANLHKQVSMRNEFLGRIILPLLDSVKGVEENVLEALNHYMTESPGETPYVYDPAWELARAEYVGPTEPEDPELMADIVAGRQAAEARKVKSHSAPGWLMRRRQIKTEAANFLKRRQTLKIKRAFMADAIAESEKSVQRVENGYEMIGSRRIRVKIDKFLTEYEAKLETFRTENGFKPKAD